MCRSTVCLAALFAISLFGCAKDEWVPPTEAELIQFMREDIERLDLVRLRQELALRYERTVSEQLSHIEVFSHHTVRLDGSESDLLRADTPKVFSCIVIVTARTTLTTQQCAELIRQAFDDAALELHSFRFQFPLREFKPLDLQSDSDPPLDLIRDGNTFSTEWAWCSVIDTQSVSDE